MLRYPQIDNKIPLKDAEYLANSFSEYFNGINKITDFYKNAQGVFFKSKGITETEFIKLNVTEQENIRIEAKTFLKNYKNGLYV